MNNFNYEQKSIFNIYILILFFVLFDLNIKLLYKSLPRIPFLKPFNNFKDIIIKKYENSEKNTNEEEIYEIYASSKNENIFPINKFEGNNLNYFFNQGFNTGLNMVSMSLNPNRLPNINFQRNNNEIFNSLINHSSNVLMDYFFDSVLL